MAPALDLLGLGESMVMVTPVRGGRLDASSEFLLRPGGAESNVAMYTSRLGHASGWASRLGQDALGDLIVDQVASVGVDTSLVGRDAGRPTGVYFKDPRPSGTQVHYYRAGSAASAMGSDLIDVLVDEAPRTLHLSGITAALSPTCAELVRSLIIERPLPSTTITFDINYRPRLWDGQAGELLHDLAAAADIVFVGLDEAQTLWRVSHTDDVRALFPDTFTLVVKNKEVDAVCYTGNTVTRVSAIPTAVVEHIGAGDAFAAGWIVGMLRGLDQTKRLHLGHLVAGVALRSETDFADPPNAAVICSELGIDIGEWTSSSLINHGVR